MRLPTLFPTPPLRQDPGARNGDAARTPAGKNGSESATPAFDDAVRDDRPNAIVLNARHEFVNAFSDLARGKRNWQIVAFLLGAIAVLQALTTYRLASSAHPVPYVVQTDRLGAVTAVASAEQMRVPDNRLIASQLAEFLRAVRTVLPISAATAQADLLKRGYAFTASEAAGFLNTYFSDPLHDPRILGLRSARDIRVTSALRIPDPARSHESLAASVQTWRVQWIELERAIGPLEQGEPARVTRWEGYLTLQIVPPRSAEAIQSNPLGLRIRSIAWTRIAGDDVPRDSLGILTDQSEGGGTR